MHLQVTIITRLQVKIYIQANFTVYMDAELVTATLKQYWILISSVMNANY